MHAGEGRSFWMTRVSIKRFPSCLRVTLIRFLRILDSTLFKRVFPQRKSFLLIFGSNKSKNMNSCWNVNLTVRVTAVHLQGAALSRSHSCWWRRFVRLHSEEVFLKRSRPAPPVTSPSSVTFVTEEEERLDLWGEGRLQPVPCTTSRRRSASQKRRTDAPPICPATSQSAVSHWVAMVTAGFQQTLFHVGSRSMSCFQTDWNSKQETKHKQGLLGKEGKDSPPGRRQLTRFPEEEESGSRLYLGFYI